MSSRFTDETGREWKLRLTVGAVADVKRETGVNLALTAKDNDWVELLFGEDRGRFVSVLWVLCDEQATAINVGPEDFAHLFDAATLEAAGVALANAIVDFFPRSRIAAAIRERLPALLEEADRKAVEAIKKATSTPSVSPTSVPESAGSTPAG